ncbi:16S rRNA (cytosine(1402)-N(4))-methyltransferase RsmH [Sulfurihydrogenibium sp.]|uniref:16S rRNA (cytosine(1402)-N(4))-methyltransferase RsmH n=1 Tax=Sulfurihydrogenibium sp. TaxID=2053621 RepID=UPI002624B955|nr:16S rRNA (cytosine(1402)-N(4))-methyltransferase RsmH [Sulfurihydrogenibium sp.]
MISHYSVLYREVLEFTKDLKEGYFIDATVGGGGHSYLILKQNPKVKLIGIDKDDYALEVSKERLKEFEGRYHLVKSSFKDLDKVVKDLDVKPIVGILFDFGVSHFQLKLPRGFSFQREEPLDMRMDTSSDLTAYYVVNYYTEPHLLKVISEYGEEKFARRIVKSIVDYRKRKKIETTKELADIIYKAYPPNLRHSKIHPATKTFQAIRIEVNNELNEIEEALEKAVRLLDKGGVLIAISFHSLEDRIVKNTFKKYKELKFLEILTKKPITPQEDEIKENPASRSAKMRVARRL